MSLSDLSSLGSFVSGVAVLVSLILLYFQLRQLGQQVRQAEKNQQATIRQARVTQTMDTVTCGIESSAAEALNNGWRGEENISATGLRQCAQYCRAAFYGWEDAFYQHSQGLFTEAAFDAQKINIAGNLRNIGVRAQWRLQRRDFSPEYVAWLDAIVAETPIDEPVDGLVLWHSALEQEKAGAPY